MMHKLFICKSSKSRFQLRSLFGATLKLFLILLFLHSLLPVCSHSATAEIEVIHSQNHYQVGGDYPILLQLKILDSWYLHGTKEGKDHLIPTKISFVNVPGVRVEKIIFPEPSKKKFVYTKETIDVFSGEIFVHGILRVSKGASIGKHTINGELSYQACSSQSCLPPEKNPILITVKIVPSGTKINLLNGRLFESVKNKGSADSGVLKWRWGVGIWLTLLGIFLGGLALNLTPCVYPLIPITVSYFGGRGEGLQGKTLLHGVFYILGLSVTNAIFGVTAALSGGLLGAALQSPIVLVFVALILFVLGLSFFGLWELRLPAGLTRVASKNFGGYLGTLFMGLTLGIVAAPCLGPFLLGLLTYVGQRGDPFLGFLYFFVLSIGLGLPLSVLGMFSGSLDRMPRSGEWMVWVRKCFGWVLMGMAAYILFPVIPYYQWRAALLALIAIAAGIHLGWIDKSRSTWSGFTYIKKGLSIILIAWAGFHLFSFAQEREGIQWIPYEEKVLLKAVENNSPVMLDFFAEWCAPCRALDREVFADPEVLELSKQFITTRVDLTTRNPRQAGLLKRYQIRGVPTILFLKRDGKEERALRVEAYLGKDKILTRMKKLLGNP